MKKRFFLLSLVFLIMSGQLLLAQKNPWSFVPVTEVQKKNLINDQSPSHYQTVHLDFKLLKSLLQEAPLWETPEALQKNVQLSIPMADGTFQNFRIEEAPVMAPALAAKYPEIKSYRGYGIDDPAATFSFSVCPKGFNGLLLTGGKPTVYHPYQQGFNEYYMVYHPQDNSLNKGFECGTEDGDFNVLTEEMKDALSNEKMGDCKKRTYRLAMSATAEFCQSHGATTVAEGLAVVNSYLTNVNCITLRDLGVFFQLVPGNDLLIYLDTIVL